MAQHDYIIADASGATVRADINNALAAIASTNKGTAAPATIYAGQLWIDDNTPSSSVWTLYAYDGSNSIEVAQIDTTNNVSLPALNIDRLTAETAPATGDYLAIYDLSATASRKMTPGDFLKILNSLTEDTTPDTAADFVLTYDTSASAVKKVKPDNLVASITTGTSCVKNPYATSTQTTQAHGLGASPSIITSYLECLGTEHGYSVGDQVDPTGLTINVDSGWSVVGDATNLVILTVGNLPYVPHKTTSAVSVITAANWKVVAVPYKVG